jgi:hypothetical protein
MARYMLLIYGDEKRWADVPEAEQEAVFSEYMAVSQEMAEAGVMLSGDPLTSVHEGKTVSDGLVSDGPHAEVAEHLGGYYLLETPDIDGAVEWAKRLPGVTRGLDKIEVRLVQELPGA